MKILSAGTEGVALSFSRKECPELFDAEGSLMPAAARFFAVRALQELGRPASPLSLGTTAYLAGDRGMLFACPQNQGKRILVGFSDFETLLHCAKDLPAEAASALICLWDRYYLWIAPENGKDFSALLEFGCRVEETAPFFRLLRKEGKILKKKHAVQMLRQLA